MRFVKKVKCLIPNRWFIFLLGGVTNRGHHKLQTIKIVRLYA
jgi:hypothetical protein